MAGRSYNGISRANFDRIRSELSKWGINIPDGDDVEVKGPLGVRMQVSYDEPRKILNLAITDKPGYISEAQIWKVIESRASGFAR